MLAQLPVNVENINPIVCFVDYFELGRAHVGYGYTVGQCVFKTLAETDVVLGGLSGDNFVDGITNANVPIGKIGHDRCWLGARQVLRRPISDTFHADRHDTSFSHWRRATTDLVCA